MNDMSVVGLCGSLRRGSYNLKLLKRVLAFAATEGCAVRSVDQTAMNLPLYNGDIEAAGIPEAVSDLHALIAASDVIFMASPEYNYSMSATLKNVIDWLSRVKPNPFKNKVVAMCGASSGPIGTARGQFQLRQTLVTLGVITVPQPQVYLSLADDNSFEQDGSLKNKVIDKQLNELVRAAVALAAALKRK